MQITLTLNGVRVSEEIAPDMLLIDFVRAHGCKSVKRGCETSNCGLCTVFMDDKPVLSCSVLAARADGHKITTLEGLQQEAAEFGAFIADQGAEQCGFCNPGFIMNALALFREQPYPTEEQVKVCGNSSPIIQTDFYPPGALLRQKPADVYVGFQDELSVLQLLNFRCHNHARSPCPHGRASEYKRCLLSYSVPKSHCISLLTSDF